MVILAIESNTYSTQPTEPRDDLGPSGLVIPENKTPKHKQVFRSFLDFGWMLADRSDDDDVLRARCEVGGWQVERRVDVRPGGTGDDGVYTLRSQRLLVVASTLSSPIHTRIYRPS
jgi:hypothetical protein